MNCLIISHDAKYEEDLLKLFSSYNPIIINFKDFNLNLVEKYDFIILSGGPINISGKKDLIEEKKFIQNTNKPIFGICLGLQLICLTFGSDIYKLDIKRIGFENIKIGELKGSMFYSQGWFIKKISEDLLVLSINKNMIEAIQHKSKPIYAIQGHPEKSGKYGELIRDLFIEKFVKNHNP